MKFPKSNSHVLAPEQYEPVPCDCGCVEFEVVNVTIPQANRLNRRDVNFPPMSKFRCLNCGKWIAWDDDAKKLKFKERVFTPPASGLVV